jgi:hypothetical protein
MDDGIVLISDDEVNEFKLGSASIYYRRIPSAKVSEFQAKCRTRDGRLNVKQFHEMLLSYGIRGWKGIRLSGGGVFQDAPPQGEGPEPARRAELVAKLPGAVIDDRDGRDGLLTCMTAGVAADEDELLGN